MTIGPEQVAWRLEGEAGVGGGSACVELSSNAGMPELVAAMATAGQGILGELERSQAPRPTALRLVVWDAWVAQAFLPWSPELVRPAAAHAYALRQLRGAGFAVSDGDRACIDDAPYGQPRWAVAYGSPLVQAARAMAASLKLPLQSLQTTSSRVWVGRDGPRTARHTALAVVDGAHALVVHGERRVEAVVVRRLVGLDHDAQQREVTALWDRVRFRDQGIPVETPVEVHGGDLMSWPWRANALDGAPRPSKALQHVVLLGAALVFAVYGTVQAMTAEWQVRQTAQVLQRLPTGTARVDPTPAPMSKEAANRQRAAVAALQELRAPVEDLLSALEPPKDIRVALLNVEWQRNAEAAGQERGIRLEAEAQTVHDMVRYVSFLADRKPLHESRLRQHQVKSGGGAVRFSIDAGWSP